MMMILYEGFSTELIEQTIYNNLTL